MRAESTSKCPRQLKAGLTGRQKEKSVEPFKATSAAEKCNGLLSPLSKHQLNKDT